MENLSQLNTLRKKKAMWKPVVHSKFVEIRELLLFSLVVLSLLYFLYPKETLEKLILNYKDSNLELANIYLENLIRINPDPNLKLLLAQRYSQIGDFQKAEKLLEKLEKTALRDKVIYIRYDRLKTLYFSTPEEKEKMEYYKKMKLLLEEIVSLSNDVNTLEKIYTETISMAYPDLSLKVAKKIGSLKKDTDIHWLKIVYKHSLELQDYKTALEYTQKLSQIDTENKTHWIEEHYKIAVVSGNYQLAIDDIIQLINTTNQERFKKDMIWILSKKYPDYEKLVFQLINGYPDKRNFLEDVLVQIYITKKEYDKAYRLYLNLYAKSKSEKEKKEMFVKIVNLLLSQQNFNELKIFLSNNYKQYISDPYLAKIILKSALATGDPKFAYIIAKDIKEVIK